jgi:hypothetical protein
MDYSYVRVSTDAQFVDRQAHAMGERGIPAENIYADRQSGKSRNLPHHWHRQPPPPANPASKAGAAHACGPRRSRLSPMQRFRHPCLCAALALAYAASSPPLSSFFKTQRS